MSMEAWLWVWRIIVSLSVAWTLFLTLKQGRMNLWLLKTMNDVVICSRVLTKIVHNKHKGDQ